MIKELIGQFIATNSTTHQMYLATYVNQVDRDGNTALHGAIFSGHLDIVKFLVQDCHADLERKNSIGCSPFWIACGYGHIAIVEYIMKVPSFDLVKACHETNVTGDTPLLAAVFKGHTTIVEMILDALASDAWDVLTKKNKNGDTCLGLAVSIPSDDKLIQILLDVEERLSDDKEDRCYKNDRPLNSRNNLGLTPLLVACERDNLNIVKMLITRGADVSVTDKDGRTPLAIASFCGCLDVIQYLLAMDGADEFLNAQDSNGCTPLWLAARTGNVNVVRMLVEAGADATIQNHDGLCPNQVAEKYNKQKVLEYFQTL